MGSNIQISPSISTILCGQFIQLEPISEQHREGLSIASAHEEIWEYMPVKVNQHFSTWFLDTLDKMTMSTQITYVIRRKQDQKILGTTAYYDIHPDHKRLTLGYSWLTPEVWGSTINVESKLLMLQQAFEVFNMNRIELGTDSRNLRSYHAIKKLGAIEEGILRDHMILQGNTTTDTIVFSILASEWNNIKQSLMKRKIASL